MNYGYAGTRELNEALVSRFTVIRMPTLDEAQLCELLRADVVENFYSRDAEAVQSLLVRLNALQRGHFSGVALRDAPRFARKIGSYIY